MVMFISMQTNAQSWVEKMGNRVKDKAVEKVEQRIEDKAGEATDKVLDNALRDFRLGGAELLDPEQRDDVLELAEPGEHLTRPGGERLMLRPDHVGLQ